MYGSGAMVPSGWEQWEGTGVSSEFVNSVIYFTLGEADLDNDFVLRSLARSLKEDGVADSVSDAIDMLESAYVTGGNVIEIEGERYPFWGDEDEHDDDNMFAATWVEVNLDD